MFVNVLTVFILSFVRLFLAGFWTLIKFGRMDTSLLNVQFADLDFGYSAYVGMLLIDHDHNNPVLLVLTDLLCQDMRAKRIENDTKAELVDETSPLIVTPEDPATTKNKEKTKKNKRAKTRWWLLLTLHNNPSLLAHRKRVLEKQKKREKRKEKERKKDRKGTRELGG